MRELTMRKERYTVEKHTKAGQFVGSVVGMGRNAGTWDSDAHSLRTAQRWAAQCRKDDPQHVYIVVKG